MTCNNLKHKHRTHNLSTILHCWFSVAVTRSGWWT